MKGVIVTLSDDGHLQCSYLGTDPSLFQAPKVDSREINYEEMNAEMKELQKIIREATKTQGILLSYSIFLLLYFYSPDFPFSTLKYFVFRLYP